MKLPLAKQHWIAPQLWFGHNIAVLWWAAFLTVNGEVMCSFCVCATAANCSVPLLVKWKSSHCKFTYILFWAWLLSQELSLQTLSSSRSLCYINFGKHFSFFFSICHQHLFLEFLFSTWVCLQTSYPSRQNESGIFHHFLFHRCDKVIYPLTSEGLFSCSRKQQLAVMHMTSLINDLWNGGSSSQYRLGREANRPALL